ncbi:transposase domain-containing protein [Sedimentitalea sp. JM2-8]|uniref:Transposase domain-containing protein n=1 Tax=Sedimentitalea xiamensis TaxID=3050037 RepID=A0ABT7FC78_9RHOB|nr:transposase domain-containing protein [Sedimentitalea xiamensis]MDK3072727.1 transposase domain-containing protein [Sedimentitalea xiamensis]
MARLEPHKLWWTPDELAAARLPDLPGSKRGINLLAERLNWRRTPGCARRKPGRGGGWEYHWSVLSVTAQRKLLAEAAETMEEVRDRGSAWAEFDALPDAAKEKARERVTALQMAARLHQSGCTHLDAMSEAARQCGVSGRTVYNWAQMVEGVAEEDWLAYLAPRNRLTRRQPARASCTRAFMEYLKSIYLRLEQPTFRQCYRNACRQAVAEGWEVLKERTAFRRLEAEVPRVTRVFAREGEKGLLRCFPAQIRDRSGMVAMEGVNADCHKIDVFVSWPDGTINRPQIVAFQDLYSGKILSWRVDHDPNKVMVMAAWGELVETWGIPRHCLFDNGREFANKWMTAGTPTRFRFKVREDDPLGVLPLLGVQVHWATPAHGQAKPIERAFRDIASDIAKDARFAGAYVGNRPDAKPENYGSRAIPAETFIKVLEEGIAEHNARDGRLSHTAKGRSFDATFAESYEAAPIRKATEEQRRLWMMGQHAGHLHRDNGQLRLYGNHYYSDWMSQQAGQKVIARFDPEDLHAGVHVYGVDGAYLGFAECRQKRGFFDITAAREEARRRSRIRQAEKKLLEAHRTVPVEQIARDLDRLAPDTPARIEAKVVSPTFGKRPSGLPMQRPGYEPRKDAEVEAAREAMIVSLPNPTNAPAAAERPADRFRRAQAIVARSEAGQPIGREEATWVAGYMETAEYQGLLQMQESFGKDGIG